MATKCGGLYFLFLAPPLPEVSGSAAVIGYIENITKAYTRNSHDTTSPTTPLQIYPIKTKLRPWAPLKY